jgi:three-Cys-motif partner protein
VDNEIFFKESKDQSRVKAEIVAKYFWAWAKVVIPATKRQGAGKVAYIDLFAGPGRYKDGAKSTPLLVL